MILELGHVAERLDLLLADGTAEEVECNAQGAPLVRHAGLDTLCVEQVPTLQLYNGV